MSTLFLSLALSLITLPAFAGVPNDAFFHCVQWDNVSVGQSCFKVAYDACGRDVAFSEQAECIVWFNSLPESQQSDRSLAAGFCVELLGGLTKDALCPRPLPSCNDIQFPQQCQSGRGR